MPSKPASETPQDSGLVPQGERWRFGDFELDEPRRELRRHGELIEVEKKPLNLLMVFLRHPGQLLTKNDLLEAVWPGRIVVEAVLGNAVAKLRDALGDAGAVWLKTVFGFGYRFDAPVERITDDNGAVAPPRLSFNVGDAPPGRPNWQLVSRLGLSGDSWLAEHVKTKARRVFKFTSEPLGLSALKREVTVFRLLRESVGEKACYVDVLDWNFDEPPWFIEAEYCPGGSLQEWFNQQGGIRNVPLEVRLDLIAQIAEALAEIHIVGILHKDLKPANVFVVINAEGKPTIRLGDFGSSRLVDATRIAALEITRMGFTQVIDAGSDTSTGTPLYFAPEVLAGQPVTVKADIYALGVMLYQFVVGNLRRQLGAGWEVEVDDEMLREDIALAAESNPERRLADAAELARNLRRIESRRVERAAQREAQARAERAARAMERLKARRVGLMAAFAALVIGFAV
ncbi:MAG TPA: protein kinase, partial [Nevskia sp.]|nr:protein kinase [Nevskia sp.]